MSVVDVVGTVERELGDLLGIGLATADATQLAEIARTLRDIGLEGPAREAERLASLLGPTAPAVDQLESFAKLGAMLDTVRLRLLRPEPLPQVDSAPLASVPSVRIERSVFEASVSRPLLDYPEASDLATRLAFIERVNRVLRGPPLPPEGDGLVVWANLSLGDELANALAAQPPLAFDYGRRAMSVGNAVVRRNALRVLERLLVPRAPVPDGDPAMTLLVEVMCSVKVLLMHEAYAVWRRAKGLPPVDLREPYLGLSDGRTQMALAKKATRVKAAPGQAPPPTLLQRLRGATKAPEAPPTRSEIWYENPDAFNTEDLKEFRGSRAEVLERLTRGAREALTKEDRIQALTRLMFLEDPLAIPAVRQVLAHDASATVRHDALVTLAHLGDDAILPICRKALRERSKEAGHAARALGILADIRGFPILWSAYSRNLHTEEVGHAFKVLYEASSPLLYRLANAPKIFARLTTFDTLHWIHETNTPAVLLQIVDLAGDAKTQKALLRSLNAAKAPPALKPALQTVQERLVQRVADRSLPIESRQAAVGHVREVVRDRAEAVLAPILARLAPEERAALLAHPEPRRKGKKKEAAGAN